MLGYKSGVATRLQALFSNLTVWQCSAHRLELAVGDAVKLMGSINHLKILKDKLHLLYSISNKKINGAEGVHREFRHSAVQNRQDLGHNMGGIQF
jgi:hypothetical protein